jgi:flagellar motility protein MotE (MotC chaperone)
MTTFRILLAEIGYRKLNFALSLLAVTIAAAMVVAGPMLVEGYSQATRAELDILESRVQESAARLAQAEAEAAAELKRLEDETRKVMLTLGFNLILVHRDEDIVQFLGTKIPTVDMPQEWVEKLAADKQLTVVTHLVATLWGKAKFAGREVPIVGYLPETPQAHMHHRKPMGYVIEPGTVFLGHRLGEGWKVDDTIALEHAREGHFERRQFRIAKILEELGTQEHATIAMHLTDAQALLGKPGKINAILALECRCPADVLPTIRRQLGKVLPEAQVLRDTSKAEARARQRQLVAEKHQQIVARHKEMLDERQQSLAETKKRRERILGFMATLAEVVGPLAVLAAAIWVGLLALANVRERRAEVGVLRAIGKPSSMIVALFLGKAALLGLLGAALGMGIGFALAYGLGLQALEVGAEHLRLNPIMILVVLFGSPVLSALASYLPTLVALLQDPAVVLRDL